MKIYIPTIGDIITLNKDWSFTLYIESRNQCLFLKLYPTYVVPKRPKITNLRAVIAPADKAHTLHPYNCGIQYNGNFTMGQATVYLPKDPKDYQDLVAYHRALEKLDKLYDYLNPKKFPATLPAGTELKIDRIYIRKNKSKYDSISFRITKGLYAKCRFWAKLTDVNTMDII